MPDISKPDSQDYVCHDVGQIGCEGGMGPVVSNPAPPQQVVLAPGVHTLFIDATTSDALYHAGAWYRFDLTFVPA